MRSRLLFLSPFVLLAGCGGSGSLVGGSESSRGQVVGYTKLGTLEKDDTNLGLLNLGLDLQGLTPVALTYAADVYKVTYRTIDTDGSATVATGAVLVPQEVINPDLVCYQHGTQTIKSGVGSNLIAVPLSTSDPSIMAESYLSAGIFAMQGGYVVSMADYLGLGGSPRAIHPYVHNDSEASAGLDMARATRNLLDTLNQPLGSRVFVAGYSQGGHAGMALARAMQESNGEFTVTAAGLGSGPYDLSGSQLSLALSGTTLVPAATATFLSYAALSYNSIYRLYPSNAQIFQADFLTSTNNAPAQFNGSNSPSTVETFFGNQAGGDLTPAELFAASALDPLLNKQGAFYAALVQNDNYNWRPNFPMRLYYNGEDPEVNPQSSIKAATTMQGNGATDVESVAVTLPSGIAIEDIHSATAIPALQRAVQFFGTFGED